MLKYIYGLTLYTMKRKGDFLMKEKLEIKNLDDLYEAVLCLETVEECRLFLKIFALYLS